MARNGSQVLLDALQARGAEYIFGIPGTLTLPVYDAMIDGAGATPVVTRHEQGAGFAADGYAKVSGETGVVFTVPGPGGTNLATALRSAFEDAVPVVAVTATLADNMRDRSAIHDVDMEKALAGCVKKAFTPDSVAGIEPAVEAAFRWAPTPPLTLVSIQTTDRRILVNNDGALFLDDRHAHRRLDLLEGADLDLAHPFAGDAELPAQLLQRQRGLGEAPHGEDALLARVQMLHRVPQERPALLQLLGLGEQGLLRVRLVVAWIGSHSETELAQSMGVEYTEGTVPLCEDYLSRFG